MSNLWFLLVVVICWQPLYLLAMFGYHTVNGDVVNRADYLSAFADWWLKLISLVFSKPGV